MAKSARVLIAGVALMWMFAGFAPSAHALFGKHAPKVPRVQRKMKKNSSPYAYLAPKKQKKATGTYRSPVSGGLLYGKPKR